MKKRINRESGRAVAVGRLDRAGLELINGEYVISAFQLDLNVLRVTPSKRSKYVLASV